MAAQGYSIFRERGHINIVYLEGVNIDGTLNRDTLDAWNDIRLAFSFVDNKPVLLHKAMATTEPGRSATFSQKSKDLGGVARIKFGQHTAWKRGTHKGQPALVQCAPIIVFRDKNLDGLRTGDPISFATGINQHSTRLGWNGSRIGNWSEGCLVGRDYVQHLRFIDICGSDPRFKADKNFVFSSTIIPGDLLLAKK